MNARLTVDNCETFFYSSSEYVNNELSYTKKDKVGTNTRNWKDIAKNQGERTPKGIEETKLKFGGKEGGNKSFPIKPLNKNDMERTFFDLLARKK